MIQIFLPLYIIGLGQLILNAFLLILEGVLLREIRDK